MRRAIARPTLNQFVGLLVGTLFGVLCMMAKADMWAIPIGLVTCAVAIRFMMDVTGRP